MKLGLALLAVAVGHAAAECGDNLTCNGCAALEDCQWCGARFAGSARTMDAGVCVAATADCGAVDIGSLRELYTSDLVTWEPVAVAEGDCGAVTETMPAVTEKVNCPLEHFCYGEMFHSTTPDVFTYGGVCTAVDSCQAFFVAPGGHTIIAGEGTTTTTTTTTTPPAATTTAEGVVETSEEEGAVVTEAPTTTTTTTGAGGPGIETTTSAGHPGWGSDPCTHDHHDCASCAKSSGCRWCQPKLTYTVEGVEGEASETFHISDYGSCVSSSRDCSVVSYPLVKNLFEVTSGTNAAGSPASMLVSVAEVATGVTCTATDSSYTIHDTCYDCTEAKFEWCDVGVWIGAEDDDARFPDNRGEICHANCGNLVTAHDPVVRTEAHGPESPLCTGAAAARLPLTGAAVAVAAAWLAAVL